MHGVQASPEAAQYETLGREDDALLVKMLAAGLPKLPAGQCAQCSMLASSKLSCVHPEHHAAATITSSTTLIQARCWGQSLIGGASLNTYEHNYIADTCRGSDIIRDEVIGKGSSAEVYKVITSGGTKLAVKR